MRRTTSKNRGQIQSSPEHPCANLLARTMSKLSSKSSGTDHTAPADRLQDGAVGPSRARTHHHLLGHLLWTRSVCQIVAHRPAEHICLSLRHEAHLLPDAIRTSRTPRPTIRCRQPTPRNAAEKAPPCNFALMATNLDIPKTIRQQRVEWDVRLQVTDLQDSLRRSPCTAEDVQLFNMFQYMLKMMVFPMGSSVYRSVARPPNDHRMSAVAA